MACSGIFGFILSDDCTMKRYYHVISILVLILLLIFVASKTRPAYDEQAVSLREAVDIAYSEAKTWAQDAELVQITSTDAKDELRTQNGDDGRRRSWNVLFTSEAQGKQYNIFVINRAAEYKQEVSMPTYAAIRVEDLKLDSPDALKIAKRYDILPGSEENSWAVGYHFALQYLVDNLSGDIFLAMMVYGISRDGNFCYLAIDPNSNEVLSLMEQTGFTSDGRSIWTEQIKK